MRSGNFFSGLLINYLSNALVAYHSIFGINYRTEGTE